MESGAMTCKLRILHSIDHSKTDAQEARERRQNKPSDR